MIRYYYLKRMEIEKINTRPSLRLGWLSFGPQLKAKAVLSSQIELKILKMWESLKWELPNSIIKIKQNKIKQKLEMDLGCQL
jgi:hypothetical protein